MGLGEKQNSGSLIHGSIDWDEGFHQVRHEIRICALVESTPLAFAGDEFVDLLEEGADHSDDDFYGSSAKSVGGFGFRKIA
jgi:hypothetical protein